ncbi:alpha/beta fold hydrolase [Natrialbaceae archaeon GCM10025810]|uniref:alpha/beta fold hydrolase n=1 Tax=Halovalidus salilacus TaxID=3075124 RepID=UPI00361A69EB
MATLELDDGSLWYETTGDEDAPPLVFIHGGWMHGEAWRPQVDRFADEYRIVTLDVRGHGETGPTDRDRYSVDLFADDLERLLEHLEIDRPILCGLSLGSMIAQTYLDRHPDGTAGAVLGGAVRSLPPIDVPSGVKPFVSPMPALAATLSLTGPEATFRSMLGSIRASHGGPWLSVDPEVREAAIEDVGEMSAAEFRKIFGALYRYDPPDLSHVSTPTLVLYGDREYPLVKRQGQQVASFLDGTVVPVPKAGHLVNEDNPTAFNEASSRFLAGLEAA